MGEGLYHFQLVPGAVAVAWRPAAFSAALTLLPKCCSVLLLSACTLTRANNADISVLLCKEAISR